MGWSLYKERGLPFWFLVVFIRHANLQREKEKRGSRRSEHWLASSLAWKMSPENPYCFHAKNHDLTLFDWISFISGTLSMLLTVFRLTLCLKSLKGSLGIENIPRKRMLILGLPFWDRSHWEVSSCAKKGLNSELNSTHKKETLLIVQKHPPLELNKKKVWVWMTSQL